MKLRVMITNIIALIVVVALLSFIFVGSFSYSKILFALIIYVILSITVIGSHRFGSLAAMIISTLTLVFWILHIVYPNSRTYTSLQMIAYVFTLPLAIATGVFISSSSKVSKSKRSIGFLLPILVGVVLGWIGNMGVITGAVLYGMTFPLVCSFMFSKEYTAYQYKEHREYKLKSDATRMDEENRVKRKSKMESELEELKSNLSELDKQANVVHYSLADGTDLSKTVVLNGNTIQNSDKVKWILLSDKIDYLLSNNCEYSLILRDLNRWLSFLGSHNTVLRVLQSDSSFGSNLFGTLVSVKYNYFLHQWKSANLGIEGEEIVNSYLSQYDTIINLQDINLTDNGGRESECDNIVITPNGVYVLEVKNQGSEGFCRFDIDSTGLWKRNGEVLEKSPVEQNSRHLAVVNNILLSKGINIQAKGVIVIANKNAEVINNSLDTVVRIDSLYSAISRSDSIITREEMVKIQEALLSCKTEAKLFPINCLEEELPLLKEIHMKMTMLREVLINHKSAFEYDNENWNDLLLTEYKNNI